MIGDILVDTNVLVYAYDRSESEKQQKSVEILNRLAVTRLGVLTTQVLAEFFVTVTRKIVSPISLDQAIQSLENYAASWTILDMNSMIVLEAARGVREHKFSFYDAQIWAAARLNQIPVVLSEDFNPSWIQGVQFINPYNPTFKIEEWM